ncbi:MAG TPA: ribonuclease E activity regulator RraA [Candidatus Competibacteraceae bacterium]|nr:ribonuclease E activity regulator RraA [Candidatus Competibacteraceae bacterium]
MPSSTAALCDQYAEQLQIADPGLRNFGGRQAFSGSIVTLKVFEDSTLLRTSLTATGLGRVLVVDGGASVRCALLDRSLAELALENGWAGVVINGCVRHTATLAELAIGIKALAAHPLKSFKHGVGEHDIPLRFAGVHFLPGQYLYADEDGLVVAARALV